MGREVTQSLRSPWKRQASGTAKVLKVLVVQQRTALEWGLDYPHVTPNIMDIIEDFCGGSGRMAWCGLVWKYMHVPKPLRGVHRDQAWTRFQNIWQE